MLLVAAVFTPRASICECEYETYAIRRPFVFPSIIPVFCTGVSYCTLQNYGYGNGSALSLLWYAAQ